MSANLQQIIKISKSDYNILISGGSITKSGETYVYDENVLYMVDEDIKEAEWGKISGEISGQTDLYEILESKQGNLTPGEYISIDSGDTISVTGLSNYDDTEVRELISGNTEDISELQTSKADIISGGTENDFITINEEGGIKDSGYRFVDVSTGSTPTTSYATKGDVEFLELLTLAR